MHGQKKELFRYVFIHLFSQSYWFCKSSSQSVCLPLLVLDWLFAVSVCFSLCLSICVSLYLSSFLSVCLSAGCFVSLQPLKGSRLHDCDISWESIPLQKLYYLVATLAITKSTHFWQVFDLGADGQSMDYVASLTQDKITHKAESAAR